MVYVLTALAAFFATLLPTRAHGQSSCLPSYTALQTIETVDGSTQFSRALFAQNSEGSFKTHVLLSGKSSADSLELKIQFDPAHEGVSLAYNLYAVMVVAGGEPIAWYDYTRACQSAGLSFFPGE